MHMKQIRNALFAAILAATLGVPGNHAEASGKIVPAPLNPDFVRYIQELEAGGRPKTLMPSAYVHPGAGSARMSARTGDIDVSFDLKVEGWLTNVKDQAGWSTCWSFAAVEAMESNLKKETGTEYDLSELHLAFFAYYDESASKPGFDVVADDDENQIFDNGGLPATATAIFSRGTGPVFDSDAPYPSKADFDDWENYPDDPDAMKKELLAIPNRFRLKESLIYHDVDDIKRALTEHGAMWIGIDSDRMDLDSTNPYVYASTSTGQDHAILLVGWDDTISRDLFKDQLNDDAMPSENGAWRIQNSWGTRNKDGIVGDDGFFWVSYEDVSIFGKYGATTYVAMPVDAYEHTYSHDPLGACHALDATGASSPMAANVFTAERDEELVYISLQTATPDTAYSIQIYTDIDPKGDPDSGNPALATPITGTAEYEGYHTIKLKTPVALTRGERFSVVVTMTSENDLYIPIEAAFPEKSSKASARSGESYVWDDDEWIEVRDLPTVTDIGIDDTEVEGTPTNLCIKAFTNGTPTSSGGSSGCATGAFALLLIAAVPLVIVRKKK